jgi:hypothetical protein
MTTSRIKDKISELVKSQLPEFIRTDYTTFVAFLEYYYKFLEQDQGALELVQNARQYSDIDQTTESFVNYFLTNYAKDLPYSLTVDRPLLIKRISDLYTAKGSSLSIETLFKVLYNTSATTKHPYDFVLRPSDGKWDLRTSIRVQRTSGSATDIKDRFLVLRKNNIDYAVEIVRVKPLAVDLFEIFYKTKIDVPFDLEDNVTVSDSSEVIFTGTIKPTTTGFSITQGGSGFRAGQIFNVKVEQGTDTLVRITKVSSTGSIEGLKFLNYGYNYTENITIVLTNALGVSAQAKSITTSSGGFSESLELISPWSDIDPNRYFDTDYTTVSNYYTGNLLNTTTVTSQVVPSSSTAGSELPSSAVMSFTIGAIARYPGQYTSTQGFLSEPDVRLQDGGLYQPFAYQIESDLDISTFYNIVKKLVHQAGTNMFVSRSVAVTANIRSFVDVVTRKNVKIQLNSVFNVLDQSIVALLKDLPGESLAPSDNLTISVGKVLSDSAPVVDIAQVVLFKEAYVDNVSMEDNIALNVTLAAINDDTTLIDELTQTIGKNIDNTDSTVSLIESGNGIILNYTDNVGAEGYFAEIYVGETVLNIS